MRTGGSEMDLYKDKDTIDAAHRHTVGLKFDGTVTAVGDNLSSDLILIHRIASRLICSHIK